MRKVIFALAISALITAPSFAALPLAGADYRDDGEITLIYDPADGNMSIDAAGKQITTFELKSEAGVLTGTTPDIVLPPFDVHTPVKFFILKTEGIGDTDLGPIAGAGYDGPTLSADLSLSGSVLPSGGLGNPNLFVPEPASMGLALLGFLGLLGIRRK